MVVRMRSLFVLTVSAFTACSPLLPYGAELSEGLCGGPVVHCCVYVAEGRTALPARGRGGRGHSPQPCLECPQGWGGGGGATHLSHAWNALRASLEGACHAGTGGPQHTSSHTRTHVRKHTHTRTHARTHDTRGLSFPTLLGLPGLLKLPLLPPPPSPPPPPCCIGLVESIHWRLLRLALRNLLRLHMHTCSAHM